MLELIHPLGALANPGEGPGQAVIGQRSGEPGARQIHRVRDRPRGPQRALVEPLDELARQRGDQLGRRGRRRGAQIRDQIADAHVDLVADGADDREAAGRDGPGDDLLVERPKVLQ